MHFVNAKSILSSLNGMNIYRGCTHGCIYCDSRSDRVLISLQTLFIKKRLQSKTEVFHIAGAGLEPAASGL